MSRLFSLLIIMMSGLYNVERMFGGRVYPVAVCARRSANKSKLSLAYLVN